MVSQRLLGNKSVEFLMGFLRAQVGMLGTGAVRMHVLIHLEAKWV